ncbi:DMT family transporter [Polycladidibacter hongkongensis]|uniref:DMT family transporter n=1 Tax=Polycladidibacter hongkongensis TaxID=1647556 RepID=UPI000AA6C08D|nr:DMT family transporter [Pseudovibrio hongkongensis]
MIAAQSPFLRTLPILLVMPLFMSSNLVVGRAAVEATGPFALAFFRWLFALIILAPFIIGDLKRDWALLLRNWGELLFLGFLAMWICGALVYVGLARTTATNATLIYSSAPVAILFLDWLINRRAIKLREGIGIVAALLGVTIIVAKGELGALLQLRLGGGDALIVLATVCWALYSIRLKGSELGSAATTSVFFAVASFGVVLLAPFMLYEAFVPTSAMHVPLPSSPSVWISISALALFASVLAFLSYQYGIKQVGASVAGLFMYLMPPYGVGMSLIFLEEQAHAYHLAGFAGVMIGLLLATLPARFFRH